MIYVKDDTKSVLEAKQYSSMGDVSDGYHTFDELYMYRVLYNAAFFNELNNTIHLMESIRAQHDSTLPPSHDFMLHKSKRHSDGEECFGGGWFIVMAQLPTGQISNHYELRHWDLFNIPEMSQAAPWDGHTPEDVADRLTRYLGGENAISAD